MRLVVLGLIPFTVTVTVTVTAAGAGAEGATSATSRRATPSAATAPESPLEARAAIRRLFGADAAKRGRHDRGRRVRSL